MKIQLFSCLMVLSLSFTSCKKEKEITIPASIPSTQPGGMLNDNEEYFWGNPWQKNVNDYEMKIETARLTDSALNRGIKVYAAIYSDWSLFNHLPLTLHDPFLPDTVNLSFVAMPGKLQVIAKAPFALPLAGDILIKYQ